MKLDVDRLASHLAAGLGSVYLVTGDEPLQVGECCDAIRQAATAAGFGSREVLTVDAGFDWQRLAAEAAALSLFAERKVIDLRLPGGKPGTEGAKALSAYCAAPPPDNLLLLTLPRLDRTQQSSKWFKAIDDAGCVIQVWPVPREQLPRWIDQRMRRLGLQPSADAVAALAERVEGNLLAARQEIEKLKLLHGDGALDLDQLTAAVADSARYDVFELVDSALAGETARCLHIVDGLQAEGTAPAVVLWALHREISTLAQLAADLATGSTFDAAARRAKVFARRQGLVRQALKGRRVPEWLELLKQCQAVDRTIKGIAGEPPWVQLDRLVVGLAGRPQPVASRTGAGRK